MTRLLARPDHSEVVPGAFHLPGALATDLQRSLTARCLELIDGAVPAYVPVVRGGGRMHVRMLCLGRHWNGATYQYEPTRSDHDRLAVPPIPDDFVAVAMAIAARVGMTIEPDICIVNHYDADGRMGLHQDKDESPASLARGIPVVSISLGDTARFLLGGLKRRDAVAPILLESGDAFVFGGAARLIYHGVSRIQPGTAPPALRLLGRLNLTFRQYLSPYAPGMPIIRLQTLNDPRVRDYRAVSDPELVRRRHLFVAEGRLVVERLIDARRHAIQSMLLSETALAGMQAAVDRIPSDVPVYVSSADGFLGLTGLNIHRGCLALVERPAGSSVEEVIRPARTVVVLEGVADPDNVGGIFRNAAAFGADAVLLSPTCCDPLYRKAIRTSMAATLRVPFARVADWPAGLHALRDRGFLIAALTPRMPSLALDEVACAPRPERLALLFGTEGAGLSEAACELADLRVRIPVADEIDSVNVAVAAGIALSRLSPLHR